MGQLTGNQIKNSYDGLIKTTDNAALGAVEKEITDGVGTSSTLKLGTTSASFVGDLDLTGATVTGLPDSGVQSVVAGTNVTVDNTDPANPIVNAAASGVTSIIAGPGISVDQATGDVTVSAGAPALDIPNYANGSMHATVGGYSPATYWTACTLTVGRPSINVPMIDQNALTVCVVPFHIDSTSTVTTIGIPISVAANDTLKVAIYEKGSNGGPGIRVVSETASITTAENNTWYELTLTTPFTPTVGVNYFIAVGSQLGATNGVGIGYVNGDNSTFQTFTTTNNASVGFCIPVGTLMSQQSNMPADFSSTSFGHRDEKAFLAWK